MQTRFFKADYMCDLEEEVNKFIRDKNVINVSYTVAENGYGYIYCCCVLYRG